MPEHGARSTLSVVKPFIAPGIPVFGSVLPLFFFDILVRLGWDGTGEDMRGLVLFSGLYMTGLIVLMIRHRGKPQPQALTPAVDSAME